MQLQSSLKKKRWGIDSGEKVKFGGETKIIHDLRASSKNAEEYRRARRAISQGKVTMTV
jgi:hypothetical protein